MGGVARAIVSPLSIIDRGAARLGLQIIAVAGAGTTVGALAALALATLFRPKGPKPAQQERSVKTGLPERVSAYGRSRLIGNTCEYCS